MWIEQLILKIVPQKNSNCFGIARSLIALSTLSILLFNSNEILFPYGNIGGIMGIENSDALYGWLNVFQWFGFELIWLSKMICIFVLLLVLSGWRPMITCIPHYIVAFSVHSSIMPINGGDQIGQIITLILIPILITDTRKNHWTHESESQRGSERIQTKLLSLTRSFFIILIKIQVAIIYLHSAIGKLAVEEWINGTALYYWLTDNSFGASGPILQVILFLFDSPFILAISNWSVILFEITMFSGLFISHRLKKYFLITGIAFHFLIILFHGLISFFFVMAGCLFLYIGDYSKDYRLKMLTTLR